MEKIISVLKRMVPELINVSERRYRILRNIYYLQPVGRRALATRLECGERAVRGETDFLKEQGLITADPSGMTITPEGLEILESMKDYIHHIRGLSDLEKQIMDILHLEKVFIVPGDVEENALLLKDMGKAAAHYIKNIVKSGQIVAVTGGSTMAEVAEAMPQSYTENNILVVPARGGIGKDVEKQANTVASVLAKKLGGRYRLLHVPDHLAPKAMNTLAEDPDIRSIFESLKNVDILVHGIGRAEEMAKRRNLSTGLLKMLEENGAAAEAFGYYFNRQGETVYRTSSIGVDIKDLDRVPTIIGVAGGKQKAEAIMAVLFRRRHTALITDEGAARRMIELFHTLSG